MKFIASRMSVAILGEAHQSTRRVACTLQVSIVIGENGAAIKKLGQMARRVGSRLAPLACGCADCADAV